MKRVKITFNKPNPLFELWLEQWKEKAESLESILPHHFAKALNTLRKYPLPLDSGRDCLILNHFGSKLCAMLDKKLEEHKAHQNEIASSNKICKCDNCSCSEHSFLQRREFNKICREKTTTSKMRQKEGIKNVHHHHWSFTCYAILLTLYSQQEDPSYPGYICKSELLYETKKLYNASLRLLDPDIYNEKASIFILISNELICLRQFPIRYHLTKRGAHLAEKINDILYLQSYDKQLLQIYFMELQDSLQTLSCDHVMDKIDLGLSTKNLSLDTIASKSPEKINEINLVEEEEEEEEEKEEKEVKSKTKSYAFKHCKKQDKKTALKQSSNAIKSVAKEVQETIRLRPYNFDIILLVDIQETCGGKTKPQDDLTVAELTQLGVLFEIRHLKIGDFTWIARCKYTKKELVLPYIVERKRLDDLGASIKDGRFREQKFRLKQSGIQNLFYLVENYERYTQIGIPLPTLLQASINSLVQEGFIVKYTDNHQDSMSYLSILTDTLNKIYAGKNLIECNKEDLVPIDLDSNSILLMKFDEFNKGASKLKDFSVSQMFVRQLLQLKGLSVAKALAIVQSYPTPQILINALRKSDCGQSLIAPIQYGPTKRQIGPVISKAIYLFYTRQELQ